MSHYHWRSVSINQLYTSCGYRFKKQLFLPQQV
jgi:hypothetical protein